MLWSASSALCPTVTVPDGVWETIADLRRGLAHNSAHRGLSVADYVISATAMRHRLTLLHEDADFETLGRFVPAFTQQRVSAAPVN